MCLSAFVLAGCGSSGSTATQVANVPFKSPAIVGTSLPARYTCDGRNIPPPLEWGSVPAKAGEVAVFIIGVTPRSSSNGYKLTVEWAVAGVNPGVHRLAAGRLPRGAHLGVNSDGKRRYSICSSKRTRKLYQFELYALPASLKISPGFAGYPVLAALTHTKASPSVIAHGAFDAIYKRR
jgi:phosphatidylethanolamine-binding protein (PEBP) family uncharacterized protein